MGLSKGLDATADWQITLNSDPTARDGRVVTQSSAGVRAVPLRSVSFDLSGRWYRAGSTLFEPANIQRSGALDLRWVPSGTFSLTGNLTHNGGGAARDPATNSRQFTLQWTPTLGFQLQGTYSYNSQRVLSSTAGLITGHEVWTGRLVFSPARNTSFSLSYNVADQGRPNEASQFDAVLTMTFGR
jgi:hypothetical protein